MLPLRSLKAIVYLENPIAAMLLIFALLLMFLKIMSPAQFNAFFHLPLSALIVCFNHMLRAGRFYRLK